MIQQSGSNFFGFFFRDHDGIRRRYGIYAPTLDRFIHIADQDIWSSFATAEIICSKIQTQLYVLPPGYVNKTDFKPVVTNANCMNWGILDKTKLVVVNSNILNYRQTPGIKMLYPEDKLQEHQTLPDGFVENPSMLYDLKKYVDYVYPRVVVSSLLPHFFNPFYSQEFISKYLDDEWASKTSNPIDPSNIERGVEFHLKRILYNSDSPDEAEKAIENFWIENYSSIRYMIVGYYKMLNSPMPENLKNILINNA